MSAGDFIEDILHDRLGAGLVVVGEGFRFGHRAAGTTDTLRAAGLDVVEYALVGDGQPVSSTRIRQAVADGAVGDAADMLGRPPEVEGVVVVGEKRGRALGYPTANVEHHRLAAVPADGVYAGTVTLAGTEHLAAISVGTNPTFEGQRRTVEAYLLDFDADLYGAHVRVAFRQRLRGMHAFSGVAELIDQMADDVARTRGLRG
jgi:riboflavin kinase/FMN adenylyltransferase